jgi:hypothetical protein
MEVRNYTFQFDSHTGGPQQQQMRFAYTKPIEQASAVLQGYDARFVDGDHHLGELQIQFATTIVNDAPDGPEVVVTATFGLRDWSGNWDDPYAGSVQFCLITENQSQFRPPIVGAEV